MDSLTRNLFEREREEITDALPSKLSQLARDLGVRGVIYSGAHVKLNFEIHAEACTAIAKALIQAYRQAASNTGHAPTATLLEEARSDLTTIVDEEIALLKKKLKTLCDRLGSGATLAADAENWATNLGIKLKAKNRRELEIWFESEARKQPPAAVEFQRLMEFLAV